MGYVMGLESRDWSSRDGRKRSRSLSRGEKLVLGAVVLLLILTLSPAIRDRLGYSLPLGLESVFRSDSTPGGLQLQPLPGGPSVTIREPPLYARDDPWRDWLADEAVCPRGEDRSASPGVQVQVMLCLLNYARMREGLVPLRLSHLLSVASSQKAADIARCGRFEHMACGRPADEGARLIGHRGSFGENLYVAEGRLVAPRVALDRWLNSDGHRENLFRPEWRTVGIALLPNADVERIGDGVIWVNQFGD